MFTHIAEGLVGVLAIVGAGTLIFGISKFLAYTFD